MPQPFAGGHRQPALVGKARAARVTLAPRTSLWGMLRVPEPVRRGNAGLCVCPPPHTHTERGGKGGAYIQPSETTQVGRRALSHSPPSLCKRPTEGGGGAPHLPAHRPGLLPHQRHPPFLLLLWKAAGRPGHRAGGEAKGRLSAKLRPMASTAEGSSRGPRGNLGRTALGMEAPRLSLSHTHTHTQSLFSLSLSHPRTLLE